MRKRWAAIAASTLGLIFIDQLTKYAIRTQPSFSSSVREPLQLVYVLNTGFLFSLPFSWWLWGIGLLAVIILLVLYLRSCPPTSLLSQGAIACILAGGVSNAIDRLLFGGVVDILHIGGGAVVNIADILVLTGLILLGTRGTCSEQPPSLRTDSMSNSST